MGHLLFLRALCEGTVLVGVEEEIVPLFGREGWLFLLLFWHGGVASTYR